MKKLLLTFIFILIVLSIAACGGTGEAPNGEQTKDTTFDGVTFNDVTAHFNGSEHKLTVSGDIPEGTNITYTNNKGTNEGEYKATAVLTKGEHTKTLTAILTIKEPTAEQVVAARDNTESSDIQGFDYKYKLAGKFEALGFETGEIDGTYLASYRENKANGEYVFKRTTSGELLIDSTKIAYGLGNQKIVMKLDDDGIIKKISNETVDEQDSFFIHKPIEKLINNISANEIKAITQSSDIPGYKYKATVQFASNNPYISKILDSASSLGTTVSMGGVEIPNIANGIQLYFNYSAGDRIEDFYVSINLSIDIKGVKTSIKLSYEQMGSTTAVTVPKDESFILDKSEINAKVDIINNALLGIKNDEAYSIDVSATNDFDPSWKITATVDRYYARLFRNGNDFNHSYEFKAHHEEDGAETYKYTLGNVTGEEEGIYLVSRKGSNEVNPVEEALSADTQFDLLTAMAIINAEYVDCIKVVEKKDETIYKIYLNKKSVLAIQQKILNTINSNNAEGVIKVNNYLNEDNYIFEEAVIEVTYKNNILTSIKCETEIRYNPTGGEYTEYNVALKNIIEIEINKELDDAGEYVAPTSTGKWLGIGAAKYYIR